MMAMFVLGFISSAFMTRMYSQGEFPDSMAWSGGGVSVAGWLHFFYMGVAIAIIGLLYFCTPSASLTVLWVVSAALVLHVAVSSHILTGWLNGSFFHFPWFPAGLLSKPDPWVVTVGTALALIAITWWRGVHHS
jgi:hypothetical protein